MAKQALIIGITGSVGEAVANALQRHGWDIRALHRNPEQAASRMELSGGVNWIRGDAMQREDVLAAAGGADIIVHAANPPRYQRWRELAMPMLANTLAASKATGARILFPGNVYNYGPDAWPLVAEDAPQHPVSAKGQVRVEMEEMLRAATQGGARVILVRAGDFFGPGSGSSWFDNVMVRPRKPVKAVTYPGDSEVGHAWAYLPDLAETFARIADREAELATYETFHFGGHYLPRGGEMAEAIRRAAGRPQAPIGKLPWPALRLMGAFSPMLREVSEMRYLWFNSLQLDNRKLQGFLGEEPHTPLDEAVAETLKGLGCLRPRASSGATGPDPA